MSTEHDRDSSVDGDRQAHRRVTETCAPWLAGNWDDDYSDAANLEAIVYWLRVAGRGGRGALAARLPGQR